MPCASMASTREGKMEDLTWLSKGCRWRTEKRFPIEKFAALPWSASCRPFKTLLSSSAPVPTLHLPRHFAGETVRDPTVEMASNTQNEESSSRQRWCSGAVDRSQSFKSRRSTHLRCSGSSHLSTIGKIEQWPPKQSLVLFRNALLSGRNARPIINGKA